jgi:hypothetical protein
MPQPLIIHKKKMLFFSIPTHYNYYQLTNLTLQVACYIG